MVLMPIVGGTFALTFYHWCCVEAKLTMHWTTKNAFSTPFLSKTVFSINMYKTATSFHQCESVMEYYGRIELLVMACQVGLAVYMLQNKTDVYV